MEVKNFEQLIEKLRNEIDTAESWGGASLLEDWINRLVGKGDEFSFYELNGFILGLYTLSFINIYEKDILFDELINYENEK